MAAARLVSCAALVVMACAAWEGPPPIESAPPAGDGATPSHHAPEYAPPPPGDPRATPPAHKDSVKVAIASVQLIQDCPDPEPAGGVTNPERSMQKPSASEQEPARGATAARMKGGGSFRQPCTQSTVQLGIEAQIQGPGVFRVEAVRLLDAGSQKVAGTAALRGPTEWGSGTYGPWNEQVRPGTEQKVSYKLGEPDVSRASETVGPGFDAYMGPYILELEVSVDGVRQTIRSGEFRREPPHMVVT